MDKVLQLFTNSYYFLKENLFLPFLLLIWDEISMQDLFRFSLFFFENSGSYEKIVVENAIKSINLIKRILQNHIPTLGHYEGIGDTKKI